MVDYVVRTIKADDDHPDVELVCNNEEFVTFLLIHRSDRGQLRNIYTN